MYHDRYLFTPLLFLRSVAGMLPVRDSARDNPNDVVHLLSTSQVAFLPAGPTTVSRILSPCLHTPGSESDGPSALIASITSQLVHYQTIPHAIPSSRMGIQPMPTEILPAAPLSTHLSPNTLHNTKSSPSRLEHLPTSSLVSVIFESTDTAFAQREASSSIVAATSSGSAPKIRFALIGVLAGVPALTILGFVISFRWRKTRHTRGRGMMKVPSDCADLVSNIKGRKSTRFSSLFGIHNAVVVSDRVKDGRSHLGPLYASSIHSTAGLAGVGAHRCARANPVPPMIRYVNAADISQGMVVETKANFDNPFGTPPVCAFITAPSRVSPRLPSTPSPLLVYLPRPTTTHRDVQVAQLGGTGIAISHPIAISTQPSSSRHDDRSQHRRQNEHRWQEINDPLPTHVHSQQQTPSSPRPLSPEMANGIQSRTRHYRRPYLSDSQLSPVPAGRASIVTSVYGGLASPRALAYKERPPDTNPLVPFLVQSSRLVHTPVLPYLSSPAIRSESLKERRLDIARGAGPVIVIEVASPTIDSESEYANAEVGEEAGGLFGAEGSGHSRRTGLIGSPHGFVPPSSTFSSASSYSISGSGLATSSSISTVIPHESSASSALLLSH